MARNVGNGPRGREPGGHFGGGMRAAVLATLALIVLLAFWLRPRKEAPPPPKVAEESEQGASGGAPGTGFMGSAIAPAPAGAKVAPDKAPDPPPVIDDISFEKMEVCSGEENLVTIKAHTVNGTDPFLHYVVDGHMGSSVPLTLWNDANGQVMGQHTVTVFGRGNVATSVPLPAYTVKDCRPTFIAA